MSRFELTQIPVKPGSYEKPKRANKNIPDAKYDKVDKTCQEKVFLSNDGNVYVPEDAICADAPDDETEAKLVELGKQLAAC